MYYRRYLFFLALMHILAIHGFSQIPGILILDSIPEDGIALDGAWKYKAADNPEFATKTYDDRQWDTIELKTWPPNPLVVHWYRLTLRVDSSLYNRPLALLINQNGASEFFLNGKLLESYGVISADKKSEEGYDPHNTPLIFSFNGDSIQVLAFRYSNHAPFSEKSDFGPEIQLVGANEALILAYDTTFLFLIFTDLTIGFFTGLTFLHLFLFFFYRADRNNLYYCMFTSSAIVLLIVFHFQFYHTNSQVWNMVRYFFSPFLPVFFYCLFLLSRNLFDRKLRWYYILTTCLTIVTIVLYFINTQVFSYLIISLMFNVCISTVFMIKHAYLAKHDGTAILGSGLLLAVVFLLVILIMSIFSGFNLNFSGTSALVFVSFLMLAVLSIPVSMSVFLARNFAIKSKSLTAKLAEVQQLSTQALIHAKEKEEILSNQNIRLEKMVEERTVEVTEQKNKVENQKEELETKNREITESLHYARYLQEVILPPLFFIKENVRDCFVLYKPKDIVAGDFYFAEKNGDYFFIAAADCTGHGVPGAMLSVLCSNALNQAVKEFGLKAPGQILDKVNELLTGTFEKSQQDVNDGMDISLLSINQKEKTIQWAGANNSLWYVNAGSMHEIKSDKQPIGKFVGRNLFTTHQLPLMDTSWYYLITDGYADQFGGKEGKKFMRKNLWELLSSISEFSGGSQKEKLEDTLKNWSGSYEQVDDITIIGIRV